MNYELIILLVCLVSVAVVLIGILFSKPRVSKGTTIQEDIFLASENTNSYDEGVALYEKLNTNEERARFRGDHRRNA